MFHLAALMNIMDENLKRKNLRIHFVEEKKRERERLHPRPSFRHLRDSLSQQAGPVLDFWKLPPGLESGPLSGPVGHRWRGQRSGRVLGLCKRESEAKWG